MCVCACVCVFVCVSVCVGVCDVCVCVCALRISVGWTAGSWTADVFFSEVGLQGGRPYLKVRESLGRVSVECRGLAFTLILSHSSE